MKNDTPILTFNKTEESSLFEIQENSAELHNARNKDLISLQEESLELLKRIHELCVSQNVKYSVYGGTQLGCVREKGFIPWDNDADIIIRREDYKKLVNILKNINLGKDMFFDDTLDRIPKFILHRLGKPAVYVDIFIYDYISGNLFFQNIKILLTLLLAALTKSEETIEVIRTKKQLTGWKYKIFYLIFLLSRSISMRKKIDFWNKFCERKLVGKKEIIFCSNSPKVHIKKDIQLAKNMNSYIEVSFEDIKLLSFENYSNILQGLYGSDYMVPKKFPKSEFDAHELVRKILEKKYICNPTN